VPGAEITRPIPGAASAWPVGSAHFNVLFPTDVAALDTPDLTDALSRARAQGAFVFWNHPGFMDKPATWFPHVAALYEAGLFSGIEVVNGDRYYPEALTWAAQRRLTPLACSDAHLPMPAHLTSARRPVTLLFVRTRDLEGLKEALTARRTLAWLDRQVWGDRELLSALWRASVDVEPVDGAAGRPIEIVIRNRSAIAFEVRAWATPPWLSLEEATIEMDASTVVRGRVAPNAPSGVHAISAHLSVTNLQSAPATALAATLPLTIRITAAR
jgi:hypothetical protein